MSTKPPTAIKQACPDIKVLALTVHETKAHIRQILQAGASGYVVKRSDAEELTQALRTVAWKGVYLDPTVTLKLIGDMTMNHGWIINPILDDNQLLFG